MHFSCREVEREQVLLEVIIFLVLNITGNISLSSLMKKIVMQYAYHNLIKMLCVNVDLDFWTLRICGIRIKTGKRHPSLNEIIIKSSDTGPHRDKDQIEIELQANSHRRLELVSLFSIVSALLILNWFILLLWSTRPSITSCQYNSETPNSNPWQVQAKQPHK